MPYGRIVISRYGGPEVLEVVREDLRDAAPGEVRVKVLAAGVSWVEYMMRHGVYPRQPKPPFTPGYDIVGVVDQTGAGTSKFRTGERVAALTVFGGYSEYAFVPEDALVPAPEELDPAEAVCLVLNYVTAYQMLYRAAHVKTGQRMLVHSAAGGVGTAVIELGRLAGLEMYGTASHSKHAIVESLGAQAIDYRTADFVKQIHEFTGDGVDLVCDSIGGFHWLRSHRCLRPGGTLVAYGSQSALVNGRRSLLKTSAVFAAAALLFVLSGKRRFALYSITAMRERHPDWFRDDLAALFELLGERRIKPVIAERLPWTDARRANALLERGTVKGKIVLTFD